MKSRKMFAVGLCGMVAVGLGQGVSASDNTVPVTYDYSGTAEPVSPNYGVKIPTGLVFTASNTTTPLDISVEMVKGQNETAIIGPCSATVEVKSANGYVVKLADGRDEVDYTVQYEGTKLSGPGLTMIGTLSKGVEGAEDKLKLEGSAKLEGVAAMTGSHTDTLTYTITNVDVSGS